MRIAVLLLVSLCLYAGIFDFIDIKEAKDAYIGKDYQKAIKHYKKLAHEGDQEALFNLGDSYYKAGRYEEALESFKKIKSKNLLFKKLHNIGNSYAMTGKIDEAIKSYEEALKIKDDKDTRYNLELLKKKKKKKEQKRDKKEKDEKDKENKKDRKQNPDKKDNNQKKSSSENGKNEKNDKKNGKKRDQTQKSRNGKKDEKRDKNEKSDKGKSEKEQKQNAKDERKEGFQRKTEDRKKSSDAEKRAAPISDMQERKYRKMLNQRGINTLMMELPTKGEKRDEINPW